MSYTVSWKSWCLLNLDSWLSDLLRWSSCLTGESLTVKSQDTLSKEYTIPSRWHTATWIWGPSVQKDSMRRPTAGTQQWGSCASEVGEPCFGSRAKLSGVQYQNTQTGFVFYLMKESESSVVLLVCKRDQSVHWVEQDWSEELLKALNET